MLATCARGTDGTLFPLCRSTAFKLNFEESINKPNHLDRVGVQEPVYQNKHHYKTPDLFLERKTLFFFLTSMKEHISIAFWTRFHTLVWNLRVSLVF